MKTTLIIILFFIVSSCACVQEAPIYDNQNPFTFNIKDEINKEIFDGFYDSDSTKIPKNAYFLK